MLCCFFFWLVAQADILSSWKKVIDILLAISRHHLMLNSSILSSRIYQTICFSSWKNVQYKHMIIWTNSLVEELYTVWVKKNPPYGFLKFVPKRLGIFNQFFYTPIIRSFMHYITNCYSNISNFDKVMPY